MTVTMQILSGSLVLGLCSFIHLCLLAVAVRLLKRLGAGGADDDPYGLRIIELMGAGLAAVVLAHTVQVWIWAAAFVMAGTLSDLADAIYFSLVTYTTLGYGDIVIGSGFRIFGAMAAVTGLLNFGISTAFLVGLLGRLVRDRI
jgi:hypothetical protein